MQKSKGLKLEKKKKPTEVIKRDSGKEEKTWRGKGNTHTQVAARRGKLGYGEKKMQKGGGAVKSQTLDQEKNLQREKGPMRSAL